YVIQRALVFTITLNTKIFWFVTSVLIFFNILLSLYIYKENQNLIEKKAYETSEALQQYFVAMRYVYHNQFIQSNLDINDTTVGFLPAHASALISDRFANNIKDGTTIRNVTDRPRNLLNLADRFETDAMHYFEKHPNEKNRITQINQNNRDYFHFTAPLKIDRYCLACHGTKEETLQTVQVRYDKAYDYKIGDIRGVTSVKVPVDIITQRTMPLFYKIVALIWANILLLLFIIYYAIKKITIKDVEQKNLLKKEVKEKTAYLEKQTEELEEANKQQQHLFSILRTVADCNQILITAKDIKELLDKTALSLHCNTTFESVKILLYENQELRVKNSTGIDEDFSIMPVEEEVFYSNHFIYLDKDSPKLSPTCKEKIDKYGITQIYCIPLRKNHFASRALGVLTICTKDPKGLTQEEKDMLHELAGDIGFAVNSFYQSNEIEQLSFYDALTHLPNKKFFEQTLTQALLSSNYSSKYGAVFFMDFDNFKYVNDLKGQEAGDYVLQTIAERFLKTLNKASLVARFESDRFLILIENLSKKEDEAAIIAQIYAEQILTITKEPFIVGDQTFYLTSSIGVVLFHGNTITTNLLLNQVEYALRTAKEDGKKLIRFYDKSLQEITKSRSLMVQNLQEAIVANQFFVLYQKQVDNSAITIGVEALLRWQHPTFGLVSPGEFIPLAEEYGIIKELGNFVLDEATKLLIAWQEDSVKANWRISVNVSPLQFKDLNFVANIEELILNKGINPSKLRLELTEGVLIDNQEIAQDKIAELHALGVSLSIDDFGTGYSSLAYLKHMQIDELKIDQSFVSELSENNADKTIIKTILMMGEEFGFEVIAEGVETEEQLEELQKLGCMNFQGYLFSKPIAAEAL
ncbi:MAG: EAL domain-containing protein, partial [Sulfurimonadaceae bacterium]|nr:EAL domain-containing protein [Sulfurimonadaceae bacterium]